MAPGEHRKGSIATIFLISFRQAMSTQGRNFNIFLRLYRILLSNERARLPSSTVFDRFANANFFCVILKFASCYSDYNAR
jgi:hypothetical protein